MTKSISAASTEPILGSEELKNIRTIPLSAELPEDFELIDLIGKGGMGWVIRGRQRSLDREVAIKVIAPSKEEKSCTTENFINEAKMCAKLRHPNIVQIFQVGKTDNGTLFIVMELLGGQSLQQFMEKVNFPRRFNQKHWKKHQSLIFPILFGLCDALEAAHREGIIHRDIKPANIQIDEDGRVRLIDFGIALLKSQGEQIDDIPVAGTLTWMAPEQFFNPEQVDRRSDIFALGGVMLYLLSGTTPRNIKTVDEFIKTSVDGEMTSAFPRQLPTGLPTRLVSIIDKALAHNPRERYATVTEFRTDLESVYLQSVKPAKKNFVLTRKHIELSIGIMAIICFAFLLTAFHFNTIQAARSESMTMVDRSLKQMNIYLQNPDIEPVSNLLLNGWKNEIEQHLSKNESLLAFEKASYAIDHIEWELIRKQAECLVLMTHDADISDPHRQLINTHLNNIEYAHEHDKDTENLTLLKAESISLLSQLIPK